MHPDKNTTQAMVEHTLGIKNRQFYLDLADCHGRERSLHCLFLYVQVLDQAIDLTTQNWYREILLYHRNVGAIK
jgi:hypothetical protein